LRDTAAVEALATDPNARVMVLVDGQNLYKACKQGFGRPHIQPRLLADHLAGPRTHTRPAVRFYTGRPNPNVSEYDSVNARNLDRRLGAMRKTGVTVVARTLQYNWEWSHFHEKLPRARQDSPAQNVTVKPWRRPREKGIDLVLGLDAVEFLVTGLCDVLIIVSADRDLFEVPRALKIMESGISRPFRVEAAVVCEGSGEFKRMLGAGYDQVHRITRDVFELVVDPTAYNVDADRWRPVDLPTSLEQHREQRQIEQAAAVAPPTPARLELLQKRFSRSGKEPDA
jgi:uncharacterized LabA/DUF88 family protein